MSEFVFTYKWKHFPTGLSGERTRIFISYTDFLEHLVKWNQQGKGFYVYWI